MKVKTKRPAARSGSEKSAPQNTHAGTPGIPGRGRYVIPTSMPKNHKMIRG